MNAQEIYLRLKESDSSTDYRILAELYNMVFGKSLKKSEWGRFRKMIKLYSPEVVYWAILSSAHIRSSSSSPLNYVTKVCIGMLREDLEGDEQVAHSNDLTDLISELQSEKKADIGGKIAKPFNAE
jgi:hypothetical protein